MGIDPIAMTNAMATGGMDFGGATALGLTLLGLLAGCAGGIVFGRARPWPPTVSRLPRLPHVGGPARLARATK